MRLRLSFLMLSGLLVALAPAGPSAAGEPCGETFGEHLRCWSDSIGKGTVRITLDEALPFDGSTEHRTDSERKLLDQRPRLVVEVPKGVHTGRGGAALLMLADPKARLVAKDATIDPLPRDVLSELDDAGACKNKDGEDLCAPLRAGHPLKGGDLSASGLAVDLSGHTYAASTLTGTSRGTPPPTDTSASGKDGKDGKDGRNSDTGKIATPDPGTGPGPDAGSGWDTATQVLAVLCVVLVLLLGLLLLLIRRSARAVAVGTLSRRTLAAPGIGAVPGATAPRPRTRAPDEATTRLRVPPPSRVHGRRVGNVPGPARPAVVRTELQPQGYVEIGHVLYRAVWAEPGRPPPAPGGLVDVTEAGERDSDVLYAFPPTAGRHAKATRP
ncbi:hypothetical protein [Streptomyces sp. NBC_00728]|uniref:hypothetical protein n=1 Tax=Streptomyces sp. NBC_00728 TaxID=2903676 RepID=UPI0038702426